MPFLAQRATELDALARLARRRLTGNPEHDRIMLDEVVEGLEAVAGKLRAGPGTGAFTRVERMPGSEPQRSVPGVIATGRGQVIVVRAGRPRAIAVLSTGAR